MLNLIHLSVAFAVAPTGTPPQGAAVKQPEISKVYYMKFSANTYRPVTPENVVEQTSDISERLKPVNDELLKLVLTAKKGGKFWSDGVRMLIMLDTGKRIYIDQQGVTRRDGIDYALTSNQFTQLKKFLDPKWVKKYLEKKTSEG